MISSSRTRASFVRASCVVSEQVSASPSKSPASMRERMTAEMPPTSLSSSNVIFARGRQAAQIGCRLGDLVHRVDGELFFGKAQLARERQQVQHRVGACADRHVHALGVLDGGRGEDVARADVLIDEPHHRFARLLGKRKARRIHHGDGAVAGERHAERFQKAVHGVRREHARARTAGGAGGAFEGMQLLFVDVPRSIGAHRLEHGGEESFFLFLRPASMGPPETKRAGLLTRTAPISMPGMILSQVAHKDDAVEGVGVRPKFPRCRR